MKIWIAILILGITLSTAQAEPSLYSGNDDFPVEEFAHCNKAPEYNLNGEMVSEDVFWDATSKQWQEEKANFERIRDTGEKVIEEDGTIVYITPDGRHSSFQKDGTSKETVTVEEYIEKKDKSNTETWQSMQELTTRADEAHEIANAYLEHNHNVQKLKAKVAQDRAKREKEREKGDLSFTNWESWFDRKDREEKEKKEKEEKK